MLARTISWRWFALSLSLVVALAAGPASAQEQSEVIIPAEAMQDRTALQNVLEEGMALEQERRWGEALLHYEEALRDFPNVAAVEERLARTRRRFDIARRYSDESYVSSAARLNPTEALEVYTEVLLKIYTHYVQSPEWRELSRRGAANVEAALAEPAFLEKYLPDADASKLEAYRRQLEQFTSRQVAGSRNDARSNAWYTGHYVQQQFGVPAQAIILEYACAAVNALDPYSTFLTASQVDDVFSQIEGNFVGLGIELKADGASLLIVDVISGSPAEQGGLQSGDRIVGVDGQRVTESNTDAAADMLQGAEGSTVQLAVRNSQDEERNVELIRRRVEVPGIEDAKIIDADYGVAYLKLASFQKTTSRDLEAALWKLHGQGMRSLILDLRGNPGGLLAAGVEAADKFISEGAIVSTRGRSREENYEYKAHAVGTWRVPLVVLIDGDSASASEIFAGAIRDHGRGVIVGERSYGKGTVQGIFPLESRRAGVRLTTAKFYSPSGRPISGSGVSPDVTAHRTAKAVADGVIAALDTDDDSILQAGLQVARNRLSER